MIAHVAEKGEGRGRVVLQLGPTGKMSVTTVEAAIRVAQAFGSEIESLFVEDADLADSTSFAFAREISFSGRRVRPLSLSDLELEWRAAARSMQCEVAEQARRADVPVRFSAVRSSVRAALALACAENGPWNIIAIGEPLGMELAAGIGDLLAEVHGTTGIVLAGPNARSTAGPVVALVESVERVAPTWRAAERIATVTGADASLLVVNGEREEKHWIDGHVRLALGRDAAADVSVTDLNETGPQAIAELVRRTKAGLVIAQFGGVAIPNSKDLAALAGALDGAILLVR